MDKNLLEKIIQALKIMIVKSPAAAGAAANALQSKSRIQENFNRLVPAALNDPNARFTEEDRLVIAAAMEKPDTKSVRSITLHVRITEQEKELLEKRAAAAGMSMSEFLRQLISQMEGEA